MSLEGDRSWTSWRIIIKVAKIQSDGGGKDARLNIEEKIFLKRTNIGKGVQKGKSF